MQVGNQHVLWQSLAALLPLCFAYDRSSSASVLSVDSDALRLVVSRQEVDDVKWLEALPMFPADLWTETPAPFPSIKALASILPSVGFLQRNLYEVSQLRSPARSHDKPRTAAGGSTRECGGYLSYIVENYDRLPSVSVFLQAAPLQGADYHSDARLFSTIRSLGEAPDKVNHCSFNKLYTNWTSVPLLEKWSNALDTASPTEFSELRRVLLPLLPPQGGPSCFQSAQFAIGRDRIRAHSKAFYTELLKFVTDGNLTAAHHQQGGNKNAECGLLEPTWHLVFGEPAVCALNENSCRTVVEGSTNECSLVEQAKHLFFGAPKICPKPSQAVLAVEQRVASEGSGLRKLW